MLEVGPVEAHATIAQSVTIVTSLPTDAAGIVAMYLGNDTTVAPTVQIAESRSEQADRESREKEAAARLAARAVIPRSSDSVVRSSNIEPKNGISGARLEAQQYAHAQVIEVWGEAEWPAFDWLVMKESGYNINAVNTSSGACGIAQAHPCSKISSIRGDYKLEIEWMIGYVQRRYKTPSAAKIFHLANNAY